MSASPCTRPGRQFDAIGPGLGKDVPPPYHLSEMAPQHWQSDWTDHKLRYRINSSQRDLRRCWAGSMYSLSRLFAIVAIYAPGDRPISSAVR